MALDYDRVSSSYLVGSVLIILFILWLSEDLRVVGLVLLIVGWGVAGGYKDHLRAEKR